MADKIRAKSEAFVAMMRKMHRRLGEELETIEAALLEEASPSQVARELLGTFATAWAKAHRGEKYVIGSSGGKHIGILKRLLKDLSKDEIELRMARYLASREPFHVNAKHPIELFAKSINQFGKAAQSADDAAFLSAPAPGDCRHSPRCRTDVEHTDRGRQDLRRSAGVS